MKNLATGIYCLLLSVTVIPVMAQDNTPLNEPDLHKPRLFADLPDRIPVDISFIITSAGRAMSQSVVLPFPGRVNPMAGHIIARTEKYGGAITSVVVRMDNREGALLTLSQVRAGNGSVSYRGRIVSTKSGDCFELVSENGGYVMKRKDYNEMLLE